MSRIPWWAWLIIGAVVAIVAGVLAGPEYAATGALPAALAKQAVGRARTLRVEAEAIDTTPEPAAAGPTAAERFEAGEL